MNHKKYIAISNMRAPERYDYFVRKVCDFEVIWGLYSDGWATGMVDDLKVIPVWPEKYFSTACAVGEWSGFLPREIRLDEFVERWIPGADADGNRFAIFPTVSQKAIVVENKKLLADLCSEADSYL